MRTLLIRCYPAAWRERYGDEFAAVLEERPSARSTSRTSCSVRSTPDSGCATGGPASPNERGSTCRSASVASRRSSGQLPWRSHGSWGPATSSSERPRLWPVSCCSSASVFCSSPSRASPHSRRGPIPAVVGGLWRAHGRDDHRLHRFLRCVARPGWVLELRGPRIPRRRWSGRSFSRSRPIGPLPCLAARQSCSVSERPCHSSGRSWARSFLRRSHGHLPDRLVPARSPGDPPGQSRDDPRA